MIRDNLFEIAHNARHGKYSEEDLLTDCLASLLALDTDLATAFFRGVTSGDGLAKEVCAQPGFDDAGTTDSPDMLVITDNGWLVTEHKVGSPLGRRQLERYLESARAASAASGVPVRVALITRDRVAIAAEVLHDPLYIKPADATHFTWRDVYRLVCDSLDSCEDVTRRLLRQHFLQHLEAKSLAPISAPPGFPQLFDTAQINERNAQQLAFGVAWQPADRWLADQGFKTAIGSRMELYAYPTANTRPSIQDGLLWLYIKPTQVGSLPHDPGFQGPYLEARVCCNENGGELIRRAVAQGKFIIQVGGAGIPCVTGNTPQLPGRRAASFWIPLPAMCMNPAQLPPKLLAIVQDICERLRGV